MPAAPRRRRSVCQPTSRAVGAVVVSPALQRWEEAKKEENRSPGGTAPRPPRTSFWVYAPAPDSDTRKYRPFAPSSCFDEIEMWIEGNPTRRSNTGLPTLPLDPEGAGRRGSPCRECFLLAIAELVVAPEADLTGPQKLGTGGTLNVVGDRGHPPWATLVSFLGLPADPTWADHILGIVEGKKRIEEIDGIGCQPVLISATTEEVLEWIGDGLRSRVLSFPERNGPIVWPRFALSASLFPAPSTAGLIGSGLPVS